MVEYLRRWYYTLTKTTAWNNGYHAFLRGRIEKDNPYAAWCESHSDWADGWTKSFYNFWGEV